MILAVLATGCANSKSVVGNKDADKAKSIAYQSTQVLGDSRFVFCSDDCNTITQKQIAIVTLPQLAPPPVPTPITALLPNEVSVSNKQFRVHFDFASQQLNKNNKKEIAQIEQYIKKSGSKRLTIVGKTDPIGGDHYNNRLAKLRAQRVMKSLLSQGLVINITTDCCIKDGAYSEARSADVTVLVE